jgi:membrane-associated phospholipid phosphatase
MNISLIRDYIGLLAPIILFVLTLLFLRNNINYLLFFVFGTLLNNLLNILLKIFIKEPRPTKDKTVIEIAVANGERMSFDKYGMPSGHAQNCGFALAYSTPILQNPFITGLFIIITFVSLFQRYLYNNHTILQLTIGLIIGIIAGYCSYWAASRYIRGQINPKNDDNYIG